MISRELSAVLNCQCRFCSCFEMSLLVEHGTLQVTGTASQTAVRQMGRLPLLSANLTYFGHIIRLEVVIKAVPIYDRQVLGWEF